jgi:hypothetical protein
LVARMVSWLFRAHHQTSAIEEWNLFVPGTAFALWSSALAGLTYMAIEPYVRRRWPQVMTSWTRVVAGRWRDPLVGRDVLLGALMGSAAALVLSVATALTVILKMRGETAQSFDDIALGSLSGATASMITTMVGGTIYSLGITFIVFLLRSWTKRLWLTETIAVLLAVPLIVGSENWWLDGPVAVLLAASIVLCCTRIGLLALWAYYLTFGVLLSLPWSLEPSRWYFNRTVLGLAVCVGLAVYGFRMALADKPAFKAYDLP